MLGSSWGSSAVTMRTPTMNDVLAFLNSLFSVVAGLSLVLFGLSWLTLLPSLGLAWAMGWIQ